MSERIEFSRDCDAVEIPAGHAVTLPKGTVAVITQSLGGTYTLQVPSYGGLYRIASQDADAIGKEATAAAPSAPTAETAPAGAGIDQQVWEALKTCFDPEIPVNIVDLGLVYDMRVSDLGGNGKKVEVKMTLTAQGCGMGGYIAQDARSKLLELPGVEEADVEVVWDPPWSPQMISPEGRQLLGMD
jgi:probable FeS assembly SUF system protein SufT